MSNSKNIETKGSLVEKLKECESQLAQLRQTLDKVKGAESLKSKFISVVSHQLRTPLNAMRWNLEMFIAGDLGSLLEEQKKFLWLTYEANQNILRTLEDLLLAMEIEEKKIAVEREPVFFYDLVKAMVFDFDSAIKTKAHQVAIDESIAKLPQLPLDATKISEVLKKILDNAIKYTPDRGRINISASVEGKKLRCRVADNGIGIPKGSQDKVFQMFFRGSNAVSLQPDASGLGLFIAKAYMEAMGGKIWFESREGKGTEMYFEVPV
ncbi:MAG: HAMP domain-containing histidine kinase [Parcubacteria group bacterium]|nr:HAMP domain-containing histidine kinase [Parcubacteria group bacterium]